MSSLAFVKRADQTIVSK